MFSVDPYLSRRYDPARQNCWHVARDAWLELTGRDLGDRTPADLTLEALRARFEADVPGFEQLPGPADPCLVLMERRRVVPHVGVLVRGRVLQMTRTGVTWTPREVATVGFERVGYYR